MPDLIERDLEMIAKLGPRRIIRSRRPATYASVVRGITIPLGTSVNLLVKSESLA